MLLAKDLGYVKDSEYDESRSQIVEVGRMLSAFIARLGQSPKQAGRLRAARQHPAFSATSEEPVASS